MIPPPPHNERLICPSNIESIIMVNSYTPILCIYDTYLYWFYWNIGIKRYVLEKSILIMTQSHRIKSIILPKSTHKKYNLP